MSQYEFIHRGLDDETKPNGYRVSDREYMEANRELVVSFLDAVSEGSLFPDQEELVAHIKQSGARRHQSYAMVAISFFKRNFLHHGIKVPPQPDHLKDHGL